MPHIKFLLALALQVVALMFFTSSAHAGMWATYKITSDKTDKALLAGDYMRARALMGREVKTISGKTGRGRELAKTIKFLSLNKLGQIYALLGNSDKAEDNYAAALAIYENEQPLKHPQHMVETLRYLEALFVSDKYFDDAIYAAQREIAIIQGNKIDPDETFYPLSIMGKSHAQLGKTQDSAIELEQAHALEAKLRERKKNAEVEDELAASALQPITVRPPISLCDFGCDPCKPEYPRASIIAEEQGTSVAKIEVDEHGNKNVTIVKSSGYSRLDDATVARIKRCPMRILRKDGKRVKQALTVDYSWKLDD